MIYRNVNGLISVILMIFILYLYCFHISMIARNITTVEYKYSPDLTKFNKGSIYKNFAHIMGPNAFYWFLPIKLPKIQY